MCPSRLSAIRVPVSPVHTEAPVDGSTCMTLKTSMKLSMSEFHNAQAAGGEGGPNPFKCDASTDRFGFDHVEDGFDRREPDRDPTDDAIATEQ